MAFRDTENRAFAAATSADRDAGRRRAERRLWIYVGPAILAATAYMDPGNVAVNIEAGTRNGYRLLWVVLVANLVAMLFQALSAKLGIVTGRNLAELCRENFPRPVVRAMWALAELAAMATDLAEFIGGAVGLMLLLHVSLLTGMVLVGVVTFAILMLDRAGFRPLEVLIGTLIAAIGACYLLEILAAPVSWRDAAWGLLPGVLPDRGACTIAVGIIGATVMPHALYLHSGLTQARSPLRSERERRAALHVSNMEVVVTLAIAGAINLAMVIMAAGVFQHHDVAGIEAAYRMLGVLLGSAAAAAFLVSVIASGISSSVVGTMAGQIVMQGFVGFRIPVWLRRVATMLPAFVVVGLGVQPTAALVLSQVALSLALPVPMIAMVLLMRKRPVMGDCVNSRLTTGAALVATVLVSGFNLVLIAQTLDLLA